MVIRVPVQILVSVSRFPVDLGLQCSIILFHDLGVQEGQVTVFVPLFSCELDVGVLGVKVFGERFNVIFMKFGEGIIHVAIPNVGRTCC